MDYWYDHAYILINNLSNMKFNLILYSRIKPCQRGTQPCLPYWIYLDLPPPIFFIIQKYHQFLSSYLYKTLHQYNNWYLILSLDVTLYPTSETIVERNIIHRVYLPYLKLSLLEQHGKYKMTPYTITKGIVSLNQ